MTKATPEEIRGAVGLQALLAMIKQIVPIEGTSGCFMIGSGDLKRRIDHQGYQFFTHNGREFPSYRLLCTHVHCQEGESMDGCNARHRCDNKLCFFHVDRSLAITNMVHDKWCDMFGDFSLCICPWRRKEEDDKAASICLRSWQRFKPVLLRFIIRNWLDTVDG